MPHKLLYLEEGHILSMASNAKFIREFPFLAGLTRMKQAGCKTCGGGSSNPARATAIQAAKQTLAGMGDERKRKLLSMLDAQQIRIEYRNAHGGLIRLTFRA